MTEPCLICGAPFPKHEESCEMAEQSKPDAQPTPHEYIGDGQGVCVECGMTRVERLHYHFPPDGTATKPDAQPTPIAVTRWTCSDAIPSSVGGFVACGDYLDLARALAQAQADLKLVLEEGAKDDREIDLLHEHLERAQADLAAAKAKTLLEPWDLVDSLKKDREAALSQWKAERTAREAAERETEAIRTLMNIHNLGGWTDSLSLLKRAEAAERLAWQRLEEVGSQQRVAIKMQERAEAAESRLAGVIERDAWNAAIAFVEGGRFLHDDAPPARFARECAAAMRMHVDRALTPEPAEPVAQPEPVAEPFAWVIPGDDNAKANGFLDAMCYKHGEFTKPLYAAPVAPSADLAAAQERIRNELAITVMEHERAEEERAAREAAERVELIERNRAEAAEARLAGVIERAAKACVEVYKRPLSKVATGDYLLGWQAAALFCETIIRSLAPEPAEPVAPSEEAQDAARYRAALNDVMELLAGKMRGQLWWDWQHKHQAAIDAARGKP